MAKIERVEETTVTKGEVKIKLTMEDIKGLLSGSLDGAEIQSVTFRVPSGGDYSGIDIDVFEMDFSVKYKK